MKRGNPVTIVLTLLVTPTSVLAQTYYVSQDSKLYKSVNGAAPSVVTFKLNGTTVRGFHFLAFDPSGTLWGSASGGGIYTIDKASGALTKRWNLASNHESDTFDFRVNNGRLELIAFLSRLGDNSTALVCYNAANGSVLGSYGVSGTGWGTSAYDPASGRYYAIPGSGNFNLRWYGVESGPANGHLIGPTGITKAYNDGGAWYNGQYYMAYRATTNGPMILGQVNTNTGLFTQDFMFGQSLMPTGPGLGYAVAPVPEPLGMVALSFGIPSLGAHRRRRSR